MRTIIGIFVICTVAALSVALAAPVAGSELLRDASPGTEVSLAHGDAGPYGGQEATDAAASLTFWVWPNPAHSGWTFVTWNTGSGAIGKVYQVTGGREILVAQGVSGSKEVTGLPYGPTTFRLYTGTWYGRRLLATTTVYR